MLFNFPGQFFFRVHFEFSISQVGGYSLFSLYVGSDPASTVHPQKNQEFQAPQNIWNVSNPKEYPHIVPWP